LLGQKREGPIWETQRLSNLKNTRTVMFYQEKMTLGRKRGSHWDSSKVGDGNGGQLPLFIERDSMGSG